MNDKHTPFEERVITLIAKTLHQEKAMIHLTTKIEDLAEDSIALFGLITAFEKEFELEVNYENLLDIETVGDIIRYFEKKGVTLA